MFGVRVAFASRMRCKWAMAVRYGRVPACSCGHASGLTGCTLQGSHFWMFETQGVVPDIVTVGKRACARSTACTPIPPYLARPRAAATLPCRRAIAACG